MVNSSWTAAHIQSLWWSWRTQPALVYPPCDTEELQQLPLDRRLKHLYLVRGGRGGGAALGPSLPCPGAPLPRHPRVVLRRRPRLAPPNSCPVAPPPPLPSPQVSVAQFRPEKNHRLQLEAYAMARQHAGGARGRGRVVQESHPASPARCLVGTLPAPPSQPPITAPTPPAFPPLLSLPQARTRRGARCACRSSKSSAAAAAPTTRSCWQTCRWGGRVGWGAGAGGWGRWVGRGLVLGVGGWARDRRAGERPSRRAAGTHRPPFESPLPLLTHPRAPSKPRRPEQEYARELGLGSSVEWCVNVPFSELKQLLGGAVGGLHSMTDEHFGISVVEYMAAGEALGGLGGGAR
jgi:hypothetical protein